MNNDILKNSSLLNDLNTNDSHLFLPLLDVFIGIEAESYLGNKNFSDFQKHKIKVYIRNFYIEFLNQLKMRFDFSRTDLKILAIITPNKILNETKDSILQLLNEFSYMYKRL